jgi:hypothetical protein
MLWPKSQLRTHQLRVRTQEASTHQLELPPTEQAEALSAQAFVAAFADDDPNWDRHSRLWSSRAEFQATTSSSANHLSATSPPVDDLIAGVSRLLINRSASLPTSQPPAPNNTMPPTTDPRHTNEPIRSGTILPPGSGRHRYRRTQKTLRLLERINAKVLCCRESLLASSSTPELRRLDFDILQLQAKLGKVTRQSVEVDAKKKELSDQLQQLHASCAEMISSPHVVPINPVTFNAGERLFLALSTCYTNISCQDHHYVAPINQSEELIQVSLFLGVACTVIAGMSRRIGDFIMCLVRLILRLAFQIGANESHPSHANILAQIPVTIETALGRFNLEGRVTTYAVCPACHYTYKPSISLDHNQPIYPRLCTNKPKPGSGECGENLFEEQTENNSRKLVPRKTFLYHDVNDYLAGLLARSDIEKIMDERCDTLRDQVKANVNDNMEIDDDPNAMEIDEEGVDIISDIFEAGFLKTFSHRERLFVDRPAGEGRYVFALNVDFFDPETLNIRGASTSCGIISLACLNIPLHLRYRLENMHIVGIIPGPYEPHLTELNHYLRPLIDDMILSWENGIHISRTASWPNGRLTRSAIIVGVCDLPAARKLNQMSAPRSHWYCSVCNCYHLSTLNRTDFENWTPRDPTLLRQHAEEWKNAPSSSDQGKLFTQHGVRWSELWRLPYWDPTRQLAVDSMHCLLEGLVKDHVREVLELTTASASSKDNNPAFQYAFLQYDDTVPAGLTEAESKQIPKIHTLLTTSIDTARITESFEALNKKLARKHFKALEWVYYSIFPVHSQPLDPQARHTKADFAAILVDWVSQNALKIVQFC